MYEDIIHSLDYRSINVYDKAQFHHRLSWLFGYPVSQKRASRLYTHWQEVITDPTTFVTMPAEISPLADYIDWKQLTTWVKNPVIMDPCAGEGTIPLYLKESVPSLVNSAMYTNDVSPCKLTDFHWDCVSPCSWENLPSNLDIIITSPPYEINDVIIGDLVLRSNWFTALHVQGDYISNGPSYRRSWYHWLETVEGRAVEIRGLPRIPTRATRRCSWIIVFRTSHIKEVLWKGRNNVVTLFDP
jgi:hypothetical protein